MRCWRRIIPGLGNAQCNQLLHEFLNGRRGRPGREHPHRGFRGTPHSPGGRPCGDMAGNTLEGRSTAQQRRPHTGGNRRSHRRPSPDPRRRPANHRAHTLQNGRRNLRARCLRRIAQRSHDRCHTERPRCSATTQPGAHPLQRPTHPLLCRILGNAQRLTDLAQASAFQITQRHHLPIPARQRRQAIIEIRQQVHLRTRHRASMQVGRHLFPGPPAAFRLEVVRCRHASPPMQPPAQPLILRQRRPPLRQRRKHILRHILSRRRLPRLPQRRAVHQPRISLHNPRKRQLRPVPPVRSQQDRHRLHRFTDRRTHHPSNKTPPAHCRQTISPDPLPVRLFRTDTSQDTIVWK